MNNDPDYRSYFLRTVTDALNHELTPAYLGRRFAHYESKISAYGGGVAPKELRAFQASGVFLRHRADFVRQSLRRRFAESRYELGGPIRVRFGGAGPGVPYRVDGYPYSGPYTGEYFEGQRVEISVPGINGELRWTVNGKAIETEVLDIPVTDRTVHRRRDVRPRFTLGLSAYSGRNSVWVHLA